MKRAFFLMVLVFISALSLSAAEQRAVTLQEFILTASEKDTVFQEILIDQLSLNYRKALVLPAKDLVLAVQSQYSAFLDTDDEDPEYTISLSRLFPLAGTELSAGYSASLGSSTHAVSSDYSVTISQPIAENAFGRSTRLLDKITGLEVDIARHQIVEAYEDYLALLIQRYYQWYSAYENLKTGENSYKENLKLLENIEQRQKSSIALPIDVNKIKVQVLAKEENLLSLRNEYSAYLNQIKQALRYQGNEEPVPVAPVLYAGINIDFPRDYQEFKTAGRTCAVLKLLEEKSSFDVARSADSLLPSLDLFAGLTVDGSGYRVDTEEKKGYVGLNLELPLPGEVERAEYETAKITKDKTALTTGNTYVQLETDLRNLYDRIERERALISLAEEKIALAEAIVEDEKKDYSYGKASLNELIDEVNRLEEHKFSKIYHTVELKKLIVEWLRLTDSLVRDTPSYKSPRTTVKLSTTH